MLPINQIYLSIVITTYNEETKIGQDIEAVKEFVKTLKKSVELIITYDRCTDRTVKIIKEKQKKYSWIKLIKVPGNEFGKGIGLKTGVAAATGKYVMFADAGLCVPYKYVINGINKIKEGYDCALATRASKKSHITKKQPLYRQLGSRFFGIIVRNLLGIPKNIKDTQCGFKVYKREVAKKLFGGLKTNGFMFDSEIILRAKKTKYKMATFPVEWKSDDDTKFKPISGSITILKDLLQMKLKYRL